ncbi:MAG: CPBP family intramembrane metalloprotease [Saprospiraceae bacterium]|nr:CPBP family intramembrane metalloprotease [Saprospiraceae bacterium]
MLLSIVLAGMVVGTIIQVAYFKLFGLDLSQLFYREDYAIHLKVALFITQLFTFLFPALFFGWIIFKKDLWSFFKTTETPKGVWILLAIGMLFLLLPLIQYTYDFNRSLPLPDWMTNMEESATDTLEAIITMHGPFDLIINILLIGLIPAMGEELLFRGAVQQLGYKIFSNKVVSVWITALIFSTIHFQFEGFIPRFILGLYLGYIFLWTNNLLVPIIAHFINNSAMVVMSYINPDLVSNMDETPVPDLPWYGVMISTLLIVPMIIYFANSYRNSSLPDSQET